MSITSTLGVRLPGEGFGQQVGFNIEQAQPPTNAYIGADDQMEVYIATSVSSAVVSVFARILLPNGRIVPNNWDFQPVNGRLGQSFYRTLAEGFVLSLNVYGANATQPGQTFVRVSLIRGVVSSKGVSQVLVQGYVTLQNLLSWPGSPLWPQSKGMGNFRSISGTVPAAGAEVNESVPANVVWRIMSFRYSITTSAAVGTRALYFTITDGVSNVLLLVQPSTIAAGQTNTFTVAYGVDRASDGFANQLSLPGQFFLLPGWTIGTLTGGMQAADQYNSIYYIVEEWLRS